MVSYILAWDLGITNYTHLTKIRTCRRRVSNFSPFSDVFGGLKLQSLGGFWYIFILWYYTYINIHLVYPPPLSGKNDAKKWRAINPPKKKLDTFPERFHPSNSANVPFLGWLKVTPNSKVTWRITPVSKWLVTTIYKPFRPFVRGTTPVRGLTNHGY